jgi:hypothetical protein
VKGTASNVYRACRIAGKVRRVCSSTHLDDSWWVWWRPHGRRKLLLDCRGTPQHFFLADTALDCTKRTRPGPRRADTALDRSFWTRWPRLAQRIGLQGCRGIAQEIAPVDIVQWDTSGTRTAPCPAGTVQLRKHRCNRDLPGQEWLQTAPLRSDREWQRPTSSSGPLGRSHTHPSKQERSSWRIFRRSTQLPSGCHEGTAGDKDTPFCQKQRGRCTGL